MSCNRVTNMGHTLSDTIALLDRFPACLNALLRDLPETWTHGNEGGKTWSAFDIIGHVKHLERHHWMARVRTILESGEARAFEPVDRWAQQRQDDGKPLAALLDDFMRLRAASLSELRALDLQPEQLDMHGRHPALGPVTLGQVLATWSAHDMTHLHQLSRLLSHRYREAVGPWNRYLGVLQCEGHSGE